MQSHQFLIVLCLVNAQNPADLDMIDKQICGDGHLDPSSEECDDGNIMPFDGCSTTCRNESLGIQLPTQCGNGQVEIFEEECDPGQDSILGVCEGCLVKSGYTAFPKSEHPNNGLFLHGINDANTVELGCKGVSCQFLEGGPGQAAYFSQIFEFAYNGPGMRDRMGLRVGYDPLWIGVKSCSAAVKITFKYSENEISASMLKNNISNAMEFSCDSNVPNGGGSLLMLGTTLHPYGLVSFETQSATTRVAMYAARAVCGNSIQTEDELCDLGLNNDACPTVSSQASGFTHTACQPFADRSRGFLCVNGNVFTSPSCVEFLPGLSAACAGVDCSSSFDWSVVSRGGAQVGSFRMIQGRSSVATVPAERAFFRFSNPWDGGKLLLWFDSLNVPCEDEQGNTLNFLQIRYAEGGNNVQKSFCSSLAGSPINVDEAPIVMHFDGWVELKWEVPRGATILGSYSSLDASFNVAVESCGDGAVTGAEECESASNCDQCRIQGQPVNYVSRLSCQGLSCGNLEKFYAAANIVEGYRPSSSSQNSPSVEFAQITLSQNTSSTQLLSVHRTLFCTGLQQIGFPCHPMYLRRVDSSGLIHIRQPSTSPPGRHSVVLHRFSDSVPTFISQWDIIVSSDSCGNGFVDEALEECDVGPSAGTDACENCQVNAGHFCISPYTANSREILSAESGKESSCQSYEVLQHFKVGAFCIGGGCTGVLVGEPRPESNVCFDRISNASFVPSSSSTSSIPHSSLLRTIGTGGPSFIFGSGLLSTGDFSADLVIKANDARYNIAGAGNTMELLAQDLVDNLYGCSANPRRDFFTFNGSSPCTTGEIYEEYYSRIANGSPQVRLTARWSRQIPDSSTLSAYRQADAFDSAQVSVGFYGPYCEGNQSPIPSFVTSTELDYIDSMRFAIGCGTEMTCEGSKRMTGTVLCEKSASSGVVAQWSDNLPKCFEPSGDLNTCRGMTVLVEAKLSNRVTSPNRINTAWEMTRYMRDELGGTTSVKFDGEKERFDDSADFPTWTPVFTICPSPEGGPSSIGGILTNTQSKVRTYVKSVVTIPDAENSKVYQYTRSTATSNVVITHEVPAWDLTPPMLYDFKSYLVGLVTLCSAGVLLLLTLGVAACCAGMQPSTAQADLLAMRMGMGKGAPMGYGKGW